MPASTTVRKDELLAILRTNREGHREKFLKAQEGYRNRAIAELDRSITDAKHGRDIRLFIQLPKPEDHTEDYDREIQMVEMEIGDDIILDKFEFDQLVMDRWQWSAAFAGSTAHYGVQ
jgi:hypothetical protein